MSTGEGLPKELLPESNIDDFVSQLVFQTDDLNEVGLVDVLRVLLARAEQIKKMSSNLEAFGFDMLSAEQMPSQEEVNAALLDGWYETTCLKWFLACTFKRLGEHLEHIVYQNQQHFRPIESIRFSGNGEVESFKLKS